jgi:hypothetical protein
MSNSIVFAENQGKGRRQLKKQIGSSKGNEAGPSNDELWQVFLFEFTLARLMDCFFGFLLNFYSYKFTTHKSPFFTLKNLNKKNFFTFKNHNP